MRTMKCVQQDIVREVTKTTTPKINFSFHEVEVPEPDSSQVLVKIRACGLSLIKQKVLGEVLGADGRVTYPCGQDISGVVEQVGAGVTHVNIGDEVVGVLPLDSSLSGLGEFCVFNEYDLVSKPRMLSHVDAAGGIGDCVRAYSALHYQARICAGDTVLILDGASSFGLCAIQITRLWGAKVITTVNSTAEKSLLDSLVPNCGHIIEVGQSSNILVSSVMEETGGIGVDVAIDNGVRMYNNEEDCNLPSERRRFTTPHKHDLISCLGVNGKWVTQQSDLQLDPPDSQALYMRGASLNFLFDGAWTLSYAQQGRYQHILHDVVDKLDRGQIKVKVVKTVSLQDVPEELANLDSLRTGKIVMAHPS
ncbi:quinone oxidoreductase-like protein 1 [Mya arenaria]|uniref:quinone oxidoreductase-like protein 1 n=1 Tax=Mya arenaria TaxID=6604 RepID=UPI0022E74563|nr:quinone oxidoreductase-like protein 1 [Mya arenaria]XP_052810187.1 quinone oxidoreductase-like protein 1 [Mya arenaria]XP_052810189.1 quinone oxidoreductase-like protein 1 [Mya arenaria]